MLHCITFDKVHKFEIEIDGAGDVIEKCTICKQVFRHYNKNIVNIKIKNQQ